MSRFLQRKINTIFIMLGNSCNMNCAYCLQHPLVHSPLSAEVNPEIYDFISEVAKDNGPSGVHLQFYGGEPLLYFSSIKKIVEETKDRNISCTYSVISNGRAITDEMVEFFNAQEMPVTISWDGPNVLETRGFDVFADAVMRRRLLSIRQLGLSGVISAKAYPMELLDAFQAISDEYRKIHGYQVRINLDEILDTGIAARDLLAVDYERVAREMHELTKLYLENFVGGEKSESEYTKIMYIEGFFQQLSRFICQNNGEWNRFTAACGNGLTVLNMDLDGKLYHCHNTSKAAGSIHTPFFEYLQRILAEDKTSVHREGCLECPALAFCQGGCKLVGEQAREETYCKLKRAMFVPVISVFEQYGAQVLGSDVNGA